MNPSADADTVHLVAHDVSWCEQYEREAERLRRVIPVDLECRIEHFGSTAVPGLVAKPIIDILVLVANQARWSELVRPIEGLGYELWRENPNRDRQLYVKGRPPAGPGRTHHVHVRIPSDAERELRFRDLLRTDPDLRERYLELKVRLAQQHHLDREAYTEGKTSFIKTETQEPGVTPP